MEELYTQGVRLITPPTWMLLTVENDDKILPSIYAKRAKATGLEITTWTLERSGLLKNGGGWYYQTIKDSINNDGDNRFTYHID